MSTGLDHAAAAPFEFEGQTIRTITGADGEPRFAAADVCAALGIVNNRDALSRLDADEVVAS